MTRRWLPSELDAAEINSWGGQAAFWRPIAGVSDEACDALVAGRGSGLDLPAGGCMRRWPDSAA